MLQADPDVSRVLQTAFGFWSSKVLLTAVELDLFSALAERHLSADELGEALGLADVAIVTDVIAGRDAAREGVTGKLVLDNVPRGVRRGWAPTLADAATLATALARPGDVVVTMGVGEPWKIARSIVEGLPA